jgi:hypothetical protein
MIAKFPRTSIVRTGSIFKKIDTLAWHVKFQGKTVKTGLFCKLFLEKGSGGYPKIMIPTQH